MKSSRKRFNVLIDILIFFVSIIISLKLRSVSSILIFTNTLIYKFSTTQMIALFSSFPIYLFTLYVSGMYEEHIKVSVANLIPKCIMAITIIISWLLIVTYIFQIEEIPRSLISTFLIINFILFLIHKSLRLNIINKKTYKIILAGNPNSKHRLFESIKKFHDFKIEVIGIIVPNENNETNNTSYKILGNYDKIDSIINENEIDVVFIISNDGIEKEKILKNIMYNTYKKTRLYATPSNYEILLTSPQYFRIHDIPLVRINKATQSMFIVKRFFDFLTALILTITLSPIMLLVFLLVKISSKGPAIFKQSRVGKDQVLFKIFKFRTMYTTYENKVYQAKAGIDRRITPIGKFLRKTRLDELPQLINILKGEMSFIGPRPLVLQEVEDGIKMDPWYKERFSILPGITGLAQVHGDYYTIAEEKMKYDLWYAYHYNPMIDINIFFQTIKIVFLRQGS